MSYSVGEEDKLGEVEEVTELKWKENHARLKEKLGKQGFH